MPSPNLSKKAVRPMSSSPFSASPPTSRSASLSSAPPVMRRHHFLSFLPVLDPLPLSSRERTRTTPSVVVPYDVELSLPPTYMLSSTSRKSSATSRDRVSLTPRGPRIECTSRSISPEHERRTRAWV